MEMEKYRFIEDPGHGWLEVPIAELVELGIAGAITPYSYQSGDMAYLEEDCDLSTFARAKGWTPETAHQHWQTVYQANTFVRNLPKFAPTNVVNFSAEKLARGWENRGRFDHLADDTLMRIYWLDRLRGLSPVQRERDAQRWMEVRYQVLRAQPRRPL